MTNETNQVTPTCRRDAQVVDTATSCAITIPRIVSDDKRTDSPDCQAVIGAADRALAAKNKALELSNLAIKDCKDGTVKLTEEVNDLRETNARWYHNPFVVFVLGAATGTLTYVLLK